MAVPAKTHHVVPHRLVAQVDARQAPELVGKTGEHLKLELGRAPPTLEHASDCQIARLRDTTSP